MVLQIFVTPECSGCEEAARLAALLRRELPGLEVELHILTVAGVVAMPAYLLDGRPIRHRRRCARAGGRGAAQAAALAPLSGGGRP